MITLQNRRLSCLSPTLVRLEYAPDGVFEDRRSMVAYAPQKPIAFKSTARYGGEACALDGVHPATMESPDASGTNWPAWTQCEVDPLYDTLHPNPPAHFNRGHWVLEAKRERNDGRYLERTFNWYKDARKFCPGVLSASGYYFLNDSESAALDADDFPVERRRPGYQDWYFFANGYPLSPAVCHTVSCKSGTHAKRRGRELKKSETQEERR